MKYVPGSTRLYRLARYAAYSGFDFMADANAIGKDIAFIKFLSIVTDEIRSGIDNFRRKKNIFFLTRINVGSRRKYQIMIIT